MAKQEKQTSQAEALGSTTEGLTVKEIVDNKTVAAQKAARALRNKKRKELNKATATDEKEQQAKEKAVKKAAEEKAKADNNRPTFKDERGFKFRFKKTAPQTLNIDGVSRKITDLIKEDEVMLELVNGNSNFIEQIL